MNASWVAIDLMEFAVRTEDAVQSPEAALEWLRSFRDTLLMEGRNSRPMPWAVELLGMADVKIAKKSIARLRGQIVKMYGKDCDVDLECSKKYGEKYEKLKKILAAATTREGVDESINGCNLSPETGTVYGRPQDRPERACCMGDGTPEPQGGPKSGNIYNQETSPAGAGANLDSTHTNKRPDASSGNAEGVNTNGTPITRNGSRVVCTFAPSGQTIEALEQPRAGEVPPENVSKKNSPALPVPTKRPHGEFGNVMLTDDEFAKLCGKCTDADSLITELDQYIESQGKTKKYKSHYATLLNWSRRKAQESKPKQGYMTSDDISKKNYQESKARLEAMFSGGRKTA